MRRKSLVALMLVFASGCKATAPTPIGDAINAVWKGAAGATVVSLDIHSIGESGEMIGTGIVTDARGSHSVDVQGAYVAPDMSLEMLGTNFDVSFSGTLLGKSMRGILQGSASGYNNQFINLSRP